MTEPLISIIVPIYNTEVYIKRCVEALLSQTYSNIEIVLVDDGSTDLSSKICDEMSKQHSKVLVVHQENMGIYKARLAGVNSSNGDYVAFSDSDDYCENNMYEFLITNMQKEQADISHCAYEMIRGEKHISYYGTGRRFVQNRIEGVKDLLEGKFIEPTLCTKLFSKKLFDGIVVPERVDSYEDILLNFQLFANAEKSVYEDVIMYHYIKRDNSVSNINNLEKFINDSKTVLRILDEKSKHDVNIRRCVETRIVDQLIINYNVCLYNDESLCDDVRKMMLDIYKSKSMKKNIQYSIIAKHPCLYNRIRNLYTNNRKNDNNKN